MKRILIQVVLGLFLCSTASTFQDGGGKSTKNPNPTPKPRPKSAPKPKVEPHKRSSRPTPGVAVTTPSGLKYLDEVVGTGESPRTGQNVTAHYTGTLENGKKFDSSVDRGQPFPFRIGTGSVIKGLDEGVMTMKVGGKRRLIIPPNLGYGAAGSPPKIPPNATVIFEVELLSVSADNTTSPRPPTPPAPATAELTIHSTPPNSSILIDGQSVGVTDEEYGLLYLPSLKPGEHIIIGRKERYRDARLSITLEANRNQTAQIDLTPMPGSLNVNLNGANPQEHVEVQAYTETAGGVGMEMLRVPSGKFLMGSPAGTGNSENADEHPQHEVTVSSFSMGKYEVTQGQWRAVARLPKVGTDLKADPSYFKGDDLPVEQVSWDEAVEFCARLSQATGKTYRLPTEAEWEYACRANSRGNFAGDPDEMAWNADNSAQTTHPVGRKRPNGFGLYDMHGNVWEWCRDWYSENYYYQGPSEDPRGPNGGLYRVLRGGSWNLYTTYCRSAHRNWNTPDTRLSSLGFRVVVGARTP